VITLRKPEPIEKGGSGDRSARDHGNRRRSISPRWNCGSRQGDGFDAEAFERAEDFLTSVRIEVTSCLITDMRMPGMTGLDLHDRLRASGKAIPTS
jgi:CheY-like chemotaxis protein